MVKNKIIGVILLLLFLPLGMSSELSVEQTDISSTIIKELNNTADFELKINNSGGAGNYEIYTLVGVDIFPKEFALKEGVNFINISVIPNSKIKKNEGLVRFEYNIRKEGGPEIFKEFLMINLVPLRNALKIECKNLHPDKNEAEIVLMNLENAYLKEIDMRLYSSFFDEKRKIDLTPYENLTIRIPISKENKTKKIVAGSYVVTAEIQTENSPVKIEGFINYLEKEGISVNENKEGIIIRKNRITKTNEGNVPVSVYIDMKKDIISRLFTTFDVRPTTTNRKGFFVNYEWEKNLGPGESFSVSSKTNYTLPFLIIVLLVFVTLLVRKYSKTLVIAEKRVSFVKTRGGEFALKVIVHIKAKSKVEKVQLIDRLPGTTKLYEKFGRMPDKIEEATKKLVWNIGNLSRGEERVISYIVYSNIKVVGRFELPAAIVSFNKDGKQHTVCSNKAFFMSEAIIKKEE